MSDNEPAANSSAAEPASAHRPSPRPITSGLRSWLRKPAGVWVLAALAVLVLAAPAWLMADDFRSFALNDDDFVYIAYSRDWPTTWANLLTPCSTHIVPLYRLGTWILVAASGRLRYMPAVLGAASYFGLVVTMCATGVLVARETGQTALGLAAMAIVGVSTVVQGAATWYAAGQAVWAGAAIVVTILLARGWSLRGGGWRLGLTALAALAAPAVWTGGLLAGPAALAYLCARDPSRIRGPLLALTGAALGAIFFILVLARRMIVATPMIWEQHKELWPRPIQAVLHVAQAVAESLVFGNLGLDVITTPLQAIVLVLGLAGLWAWSRGGPRRVNPLEAAGATVVVGSYFLVYVFRGNLPFSSLRPVTWYNAIPQVGAVLFAAGWWAGLRPAAQGPLTRRGALVVAGVVVVMALIQAPRAERRLIQGAPPLTPSEARRFLIPLLQRLRALLLKAEHHERQVRALARLEKVQSLAWQLNAGRRTLRGAFGRQLVPGLTAQQDLADAIDLLVLPPDDRSSPPDPARLHDALDDLLRPDLDFRPAWISPDEHWPPK